MGVGKASMAASMAVIMSVCVSVVGRGQDTELSFSFLQTLICCSEVDSGEGLLFLVG